MRPPILALLLALPLLASCAPEGPAGDVAGEPETPPGLDALYDRFRAAYDELDLEALADLYAEDALYLPPGGGIRQGREAVREGFATFFGWAQENGMAVAIDFEIVDRTVQDDLAVDVGYYTLTTTPPAGSDERPGRSVGKFVTVAAPDADGRWRFRVDAYNTAPAEVLDPGPEPVAVHPATPSP
jgi:uncharacterized protein (TIGR02246 family)